MYEYIVVLNMLIYISCYIILVQYKVGGGGCIHLT